MTSHADSLRLEIVVSKVVGKKRKKDHKGKRVSKKKMLQVILEDKEDKKEKSVLETGTKCMIDC